MASRARQGDLSESRESVRARPERVRQEPDEPEVEPRCLREESPEPEERPAGNGCFAGWETQGSNACLVDGNTEGARRIRPAARSPEVGELPASDPVRSCDSARKPSRQASEDLRISEEASNDKRVVSSPEGGSEEGCRRGKSFEGCSRRGREGTFNPRGEKDRPQRDESQDRQRGATNPRGFVRRKPPRR